MGILPQVAPATVRRAFFVLTVALASLRAAAPPAAPAPLAQIGKPDSAEAARILEQFRQSGVAGHYYLEFDLRHLPRRGDERVFSGRLWGSRNHAGPVERIVVTGAHGQERRLLVQHGARPAAWRLVGGRAEPMPPGALFESLVPGVELTAFDLLMPFLAWPDPAVERVVRMRGRPAHEFVFRPPPDFAAQHARLGLVRSYFDAQYNAPVQTELLAPDGAALKTLSLIDLKKVAGQWIVKSLEVRDEATRDKTRLVITAAALDLALPETAFAPAALDRPLTPPAAERLTPLDR